MAKHRDLSILEYQSMLDVQTEGMNPQDKADFLAHWEKRKLEFRGNSKVFSVLSIDKYAYDNMHRRYAFVQLHLPEGPRSAVVYVEDLYACVPA